MSYFNDALEQALVVCEAVQRSDRHLLTLLKNSRAQAGHFGSGSIMYQDDATRQAILDYIKKIVPPALDKHLPYYVSQVAKGNLSLWTIDGDKDRIARTINAFTVASRKQNWTESRNIYDHQDWRVLEKQLIDFGSFNKDYNAEQQHSIILYTKVYADKAKEIAARLAGVPLNQTPSTTYWFRKILTVAGACKYGRGTTWCTSETHSGVNPEEHIAAGYLKDSGLYIVEKTTIEKARQPILQASGHEIRGPGDTTISKFAPILAHFVNETLNSPAGQQHIDHMTRNLLIGRLRNSGLKV